MLLFSLLHLAGVKAVNPKYETTGDPAVTLDDIKHFRQLHSKCPGHPGIDGPAGRDHDRSPGRGIATSVGMAMRRDGWAPSTTARDSICSTTRSSRSAATDV